MEVNDNDINDLSNLHCPECPFQPFFGIKSLNGDIILQYKCNLGHSGEKPIINFGDNEFKNYRNIKCLYCNSLNDNMNYCIECKNNICSQIECLSEHQKLFHQKIFKINDNNNLCPFHLNFIEFYCETCNLSLCQDCPNFHINHTLKHISEIKFEKFKMFEEKFIEMEKKLNEIIKNFDSYLNDLQNKYNKFKNRFLSEKKFIKSIIKTYKKNSSNVEIIQNIANIHLNKIVIPNNLNINDFLNENIDFSMIKPFELKKNNNTPLDKDINLKKGILKFDNGTYEGEIENLSRNGKGTFSYNTGEKYIGDWIFGKKEGKGEIIYSNGDKFEGFFSDDKIEGTGRYYYKNGKVYIGEFNNNKIEGKGKLIYINGDIYEGDFKNGKKSGFGKYIFYKSNDIFEGKWDNDKRNGEGKFIYSNGFVFKGFWENDIMKNNSSVNN